MRERTEATTTCIDAGRCLCGEWVSTPHRDCLALADDFIRHRFEEPESDNTEATP